MRHEVSHAALNNVTRYLLPYDQKVKQVNGAYGHFNGLIADGDAALDERLDVISILFEQDVLQRIPALVGDLADGMLEQQGASLNWDALSLHICEQLYTAFYGILVGNETAEACQTVFEWLFDASQVDFHLLPEKQQVDIAACFAKLRQLIVLSVAEASVPTDLATATVVARALAFQQEFALSDDAVVDLLLGVLVGSYPVLMTGFEALFDSLTTNKKFQSTVYQAASVGDQEGIEWQVGLLPWGWRRGPIARIVAEDHRLDIAGYSTLHLKKNELINFCLNERKTARDGFPPGIGFNKENPAYHYLRFGVEPHLSFGGPVAVTILSVVLMKLFSTHRIQDYRHNELHLVHLPLDPMAYHFSLLGSSPPWAIGEEQAWLLDSSGFTQHIQHNVLSLKELLYVLFLQRRVFFKPGTFYACYDKTHHIVMGSSFSGGGQATLGMGDRMHRFFLNTQRQALKPASKCSESEHFDAVLDAYSSIRNNYYSWAYFTAFLDKGYPFLYEALLLFRRKPRFKPLSIAGDVLLVMVLGLIRVLLALPVLKDKLNTFLTSTIDLNLAAMGAAIATLDKVLSDGRPYIFGDEFTAADIHVCANMGNLIVPEEYQGGGKLPALDRYPPTYRAKVAEFRETLTGQYVLRVYRQHRIVRSASVVN